MDLLARESRNECRRTLVKRISQLDKWLAFAFGVVFCSVLLYLGTVVQNPGPLTVKIYVTVLSLAAAGIGAILPGFLELKYKDVLRAGGAIALGVLVYASEPRIGAVVPNYREPTTLAEPVVNAFLAALDTGKPEDSWALLPESARQQVDNNETRWDELYKNNITPLGALVSRVLVSQDKKQSPQGVPPGIYRTFTFKSKRQADQGFRFEAVTVRANSANAWEVYSYDISPITTPS